MELSAIIIVGHKSGNLRSGLRDNGTKAQSKVSAQSNPIVCWDLLGQSVLRRTIERLRDSGVQSISVLDAHNTQQPWQKAVLDYKRAGAEYVLIVELDSYAELNLNDLFRFHCATGSPVTNVVTEHGPLGITLLSTSALEVNSNVSSRLSALSSCSATYEFSGFVHPLSSAADYRQLVQYALAGLCHAKPAGKEVQPGIWIADGARLHSSVRALAPCFIGAKTRVRAGAIIAPGSAIEQFSEIDCGTVVESSSILPHTYVAPGLRISNALVHGSRFIHLGRNLELELSASGLVDSTEKRSSHRLVQTLTSLFAFGGSGLDLPTPSRAPASLDYVRGNSFIE